METEDLTQDTIKRVAAMMGHKGGMARARNLSPERLSEIGRNASLARWARQRAKEAKKKEE